MPYTLYGMPSSLYTGKARSYLRTQGIDFVELSPGSDRYLQVISPHIGRWIMPVLETPDGEFVQDSADIIDHFEMGPGRHLVSRPAYPDTPTHRALAHVFSIYGGEGLFRTSLHYRWNYPEQMPFLESEFALMYATRFGPEEVASRFAKQVGRLKMACEIFAITPETQPTIEDAFEEWIRLFDAHLADHPYLLGAEPTLGDYGLMAAMWAHLFRDPVPQNLIKLMAPRVGRWVERMSTTEPYLHEYGGPSGSDFPSGLIPDDEVPDSLLAMLRFVAEDYLPELAAHVEVANVWLDANPDIEVGTNGLANPGDRGLTGGGPGDPAGTATFEWRGHRITTPVMPYRFWLLQRLHDDLATAASGDQARVRATFAAAGLESLLDLRTRRRVQRVDNLEVWGPVEEMP